MLSDRHSISCHFCTNCCSTKDVNRIWNDRKDNSDLACNCWFWLLPYRAGGRSGRAGKITYIENGWYGEGVVIHSSTNAPSGCSASLNDFAIDKNHASYKELVAIALSAYNSNADAEVIVDTGVCAFGGRTKVLSIRMKK